jgi:hypothetical protein
VLKELGNDCWSHESCQGIQDGEVACYGWVTYIDGGARIGAKGGANGGPTMVGPDVVTRACCCRRWCCCSPAPQSQSEVHVDDLSPRVVEVEPR